MQIKKVFFIICVIGWGMTSVFSNDNWSVRCLATNTINNITYVFPSEGYAWEFRDSIINQCSTYIQENLRFIQEQSLNGNYTIQIANYEPGSDSIKNLGTYDPWKNKAFFIVGKGINSPIKHELMHLVIAAFLGVPQARGQWMNEGIATLADNNCLGYQVKDVYRFLLAKGQLIKPDSLRLEFYKAWDMISYHQSAYLVEYLIETHGLAKFKRLWMHPDHDMKAIYGFSFKELHFQIEEEIKSKSPIIPPINWDDFKNGCY